jgi:uncharacterized protein YhhL (DUF1145 family)
MIYATALASAFGWMLVNETGTTLQRIAIAMLCIHLFEILIFLEKLKQQPGNLWRHVALTFLFGVLHLKSLKNSKQTVAQEL